MSFQTAIHNLPTISGYPQAQRYFNETRKPPRSKRWEEHQRPLHTTSATHYRIERSATTLQGSPEFYDLMLYGTSMARYFQPEADGSSVVWLRNHNSTTSRQFLWRVANFSGHSVREAWDTTDQQEKRQPKRPVRIPLSTYVSSAFTADNGVTVPSSWSAVLTFKDNGLVLERSAHRPVYIKRTSKDATATRTEFMDKLKPYIDILLLSIPSVHAETKIKRDDGRAFKGIDYYPRNKVGDLLQWSNERLGDMSEPMFKVLQDIFAAVYKHAFGVWVQREVSWQDAHKYFHWSGSPIPEHMPMLSPDAVRSSFERYLRDNICPIRKGDVPVDLGQFPESLPKTYYY